MTDPSDLEDLLRSGDPAGPASPDLAARLRRRFVAGELAPGARSLAGREGRSAEEVIEDLLHALPPPPAARAAFREDLRARFTRGELRERPAPPARLRAAGRRASPLARVLAGGLAAAAALWLVARLLLPSGPEWRAVAAVGDGPIVVDGRAIEPRDLALLGPAFAAGRVIESGARRVELVRDDALVLALLPGAVVETRGDGSAGDLRFALRAGEVYLKSREGYAGPAVVVETPHADVRMTGTVVGVRLHEAFTCVCVARGAVAVRAGGEGEPLPCVADHSQLVRADGERSRLGFQELPDAGGAHVRDLQAFAGQGF